MITKFSVHRPYTVFVSVVIIIILGIVSFTNMSTDLFPSINLPYTVIMTPYPGAGPETVEQTVTSPIEQRMASVSNIRSLNSISQENISIVILEFNEDTNMDSAVIEVRENLDMIAAYFPDRVGNSNIMKINPDMMPIMTISAAVDNMDASQASAYIKSTVIPAIESVEGIASVSASGLVQNKIFVMLSDEKIDAINENISQQMMAMMAARQAGQGDSDQNNEDVRIPTITMTAEMLEGILKGQNFAMPAGYVTENGLSYLVRTGDRIADIEELKDLPVMVLPFGEGQTIRLTDVADVVVTDDSDTRYSKVNGLDAVILTVQKQTEYVTSELSEEVRNRMDTLMEQNGGLHLTTLMDQGEYIDIVVETLSYNLLFGGLLALLILILFLRDIKPTLIVAIAIPVSLVAAFVMMYFSNITMNIISMGGLALGVGMLVDNSIVVIENIYRMRSEGKEAKQAAIDGARQVGGAIIASTLTTVGVFLPIVFTHGLTRQIFSDMGLTIAYSLLASLLIALTLVPTLASRILSRQKQKQRKVFDSLQRVYSMALRFSLKRKWIVIVVVIVLFAFSIVGALSMGTALFPPSDSGQISVTLTMPRGSDFDTIASAADEVMFALMEIDAIQTVGVTPGGGFFGMGGGGLSETVSYYITLREDRRESTERVAQKMRDVLQPLGHEVQVDSAEMRLDMMAGGDIAIEIRGRDFDELERISKEIAAIVDTVEGTTNVHDGIDATDPEYRIIVDKQKSIAASLTVAQVFMEISDLLAPHSVTTELNVGARDYDVYVKEHNMDDEKTLEDIKNIIFETPQGEKVALTDVASIEEATGFASIRRVNQQRTLTVTAETASGYNIGLVNNDINRVLADYELPEGYRMEQSGEAGMIVESFEDLFLMLLLGIAFIYLIMVAQFQSLKSPFIVMFTIPLAFTGGFIGLMVTQNPVSIVAFVGLIVLSGVVVNNGIVFVDYVNKMKEQGLSQYEALMKAGQDRMRPILMTALTTIFALSTISLGAGTGTELMQPMAITAIGGLLYATLLTLLFIPVLYDALHRKHKKAVDTE